MTEHEQISFNTDRDIKDDLARIKNYLEIHIRDLSREAEKKDAEIKYLKEVLEKARQQTEGNSQLINKLLGELNKLHNDIDWYKRTYEKRSLLGVIKDKVKFYFR